MSVNGTKYTISALGHAYKNEQAFKMAWIAYLQKTEPCDVFEVENEEKEPGFPDVLCINRQTGVATLYEIKVAREGGIFKFEKTQPRFYMTHPQLNICVVVWDAKQKVITVANAQWVLKEVLRTGLKVNVRNL